MNSLFYGGLTVWYHQKMRRFLLMLHGLIILLSTAGAGEVPFFTNEDLERYKDNQNRGLTVPDTGSSAGSNTLRGPDADSGKGRDLKRYEVPYKAYEGSARRIIIPVTLNESVTVPMVLDTGAPGMHISSGLAKELGVFERDEGKVVVEAGGIGRPVPAIYTVIDVVQVGGARDRFIPTMVSESPVFRHFQGLIGMDFMANYHTVIDTRRNVVIFEELPSDSRMFGGHDEAWWRTTFMRFASMKKDWRTYRESLNHEKGDQKRIENLKEYADLQYKEAEKLLKRLENYAIDSAVPMELREY